jgi:uncharacterized protein (DUF1778 family)
MEKEKNKDERIEIRLSSQDKIKFKKAQKLSGDKTFSSFITRIVRRHAEKIISANEKILASEKDREVFFDAVFGNLEPNEKLLAAAKRYKEINSEHSSITKATQ